MKRAQVEPMQIIILFIILAIVAGILIFVFTGQLSKEKNITSENINKLGDDDKDNVPNFLDKCPNVPGSAEFEGCPTQAALDAANAIKK